MGTASWQSASRPLGRSPERVINALLEGSLPPQLSSLDPSMPLRAPTPDLQGRKESIRD